MDAIHPLRQFRKSQIPPLTQKALGDRVGVGRVTVTRWESGKRRITEDWLPAVMRETGLGLGDLRPDLALLVENGVVR